MRDIARRSFLAGISALPAATVAVAMPLPVLARPAAADIALIEQAALVRRLSCLSARASDRLARKEDIVMLAGGPRLRGSAEDPAAWAAEKIRLEQANGVADATALHIAIHNQLCDAVELLIGMAATTSAGLAAKAGAFLALMEEMDSADQNETELARSIARDAMRIGGQANV